MKALVLSLALVASAALADSSDAFPDMKQFVQTFQDAHGTVYMNASGAGVGSNVDVGVILVPGVEATTSGAHSQYGVMSFNCGSQTVTVERSYVIDFDAHALTPLNDKDRGSQMHIPYKSSLWEVYMRVCTR